ncbi:MAG: hypothetical protein KAH10_07495 [Flavobacteriales bacterium]|nr:hypothetical protein [Flavobacteriales bacterium]
MKKKHSWIIITIVFAIVIIISANYFINNFIDKKIDQISSTFDEFDYKSTSVSILSRKVTINSLTIKDSSYTNIFKSPIDLKLKELTISGFNVFAFVRKKELGIGSILIDGLDAKSLDFNKLTEKRTNTPNKSKDSTSVEKTKKVNTILVDEVTINNLKFIGYNPNQKENKSISIKLLASLKLDEVKLNLDKESKSPLSINNINLRVDSLEKYLPKSISRLNIEDIEYTSNDNKLTLAKLKLKPLKSKKEYNRYYKYRKNWLELDIKGLDIEGLNQTDILANKSISLELINIDNLYINVFSNKKYDFSQQKKKFPLELIRNLKIPTNINSIVLHNGLIKYEEWHDEDSNVGSLNIEGFKAKINNISNDKNTLSKNKYTSLSVDANIEHNLPVHLNVKIDNTSKNYSFSADGNVGDGKLSVLSKYTEGAAGLKIIDGRVIKGKFNFEGDYNFTKGSFLLEYTNLETEIITGGNTKKIIVKLYNDFSSVILRTENPSKDGLKVGNILHYRPDNKGFVNIYIGSMLNGLADLIAPSIISNAIKKKNKKALQKKGYNISD